MQTTSGERLPLTNESDLAGLFGDGGSLLVSGPRVGHGGLLRLGCDGLSMIDRYSCLGLARSMSGDRLARGFSSGRAARPTCDVVIYDDSGFRDYRRIDGVGNLHDVAFDAAGTLYAVNTSGNAVLRIDEDAIATHWAGPPYFDGWHVNCITILDGETYATAFTSTAKASGWRNDPTPDGMLFRLSDGHVVCRGLAKPHDPRRLDDRWLVCESGTSEVLAIADDGTIVRRRRFADFTRGLAWSERFLFVGDSNPRGLFETGATSTIHVVDRTTWEPVASFALPVPEVYALVYEPPGSADPARYDLGTVLPRFSGVPAPSAEPWPTMDFVRPTDQAALLSYAMPAEIACDSHFVFDLSVRNEAPAAIASVGPAPVQILAQWHDLAGNADVWNLFEFTEPLAAGAERTQGFFVPTPQRPGRYVLRLAVTQFDTPWTNVRVVTNNIAIAVRDDLPRTSATAALATVAGRASEDRGPGVLASWSSAGVDLDDGHRRERLDGVATRGMRVDGGVVARAASETPLGDLLVMYDAAGIARAITRRALRASGREAILDDVAAAPPDAIALRAEISAALRIGFGTNGNRRREESFANRFRAQGVTPAHGLFPISRVLDDASIRVTLSGEAPRTTVVPGSSFVQTLTVGNQGDAFLVASGANAVVASYRWIAADRTPSMSDAEAPRSALRTTIGPGAEGEVAVRVVAPRTAGRYRLVVSLLQESGRWFVDLDRAFAWDADFDVVTE